MGAKSAKKSAKQSSPALAPAAVPAAAVPAPATGVPAAPAEETTSWIDSADPRKRLIGKVVLVGVWVYVAALWLLALDQTFQWGIFGPKAPPVP